MVKGGVLFWWETRVPFLCLTYPTLLQLAKQRAAVNICIALYNCGLLLGVAFNSFVLRLKMLLSCYCTMGADSNGCLRDENAPAV
jgi:hypothetical protein